LKEFLPNYLNKIIISLSLYGYKQQFPSPIQQSIPRMKNVIRILLWVVLGLIIALLLVPFVFQERVQRLLKEEINETIDAEVDFQDVSLSLIKNFPDLTLVVDGLTIKGLNEFAGKELMTAKKVTLGTDLVSIIKSEEGINLRSFTLEQPRLHIIVDEKDNRNYQIVKENNNTKESAGFFGNIEAYSFEDGTLIYEDRSKNIYSTLEGIDHEGYGDFEDVTFDLVTKTTVDNLNLRVNSIPYLTKAKLKSDIDLAIDLNTQTYTFKENLSTLNDLDLSFVGDIKVNEEDLHVDLDIAAPNNKVSSILSIIPKAYNRNFTDLVSRGNSFLKGNLRGIYNGEKNIYPKFELKINIDDGYVKYPDLSLPVEEIDLDILIRNQQADLTDLVIDIGKFKFQIEDNLMVGQLKIDDALGDQSLKGLIDGTVDLSKINQAIPTEGLSLNSGVIAAKVSVDARAEDIKKENYRNIVFDGTVNGSNLDLIYDNYPITASALSANLSPENLNTEFTEFSIGKSDFEGTAQVNNPLQLVSGSEQPLITVKGKSKLLDIDDFLALNTDEESLDTLNTESYLQSLNLALNYEADKLAYKDYDLTKLDLNARIAEEQLEVVSSSLALDTEQISFSGQASPIFSYLTEEDTLDGKFFIDADKLDANKYLGKPGEEVSNNEHFIVPTNLDLAIVPSIGELVYDDYIFKNAEGNITIDEGMARLWEASANTMQGKLNIEGLYDSSDPKLPLFDLKYDMSGIDFREMSLKSETFKVLAPIISYIDGTFNSTLVMSGPLKDNKMPDLTQVTAAGFLETLEGNIDGFRPLEKIGEALGIEALKELKVKGSKNWFDVKDGKVILKPHDHLIDDMTFTVGGTHSLSQDLDYAIKAIIPRDKLKKDKLGKKVEFGMDYLEKQATSRGVDIDLGDMIYLDIFITGNIKNPKLKVLPVGSGGKTIQEVVKDEVVKQTEVLKDTITQELEKRTETIKDTIVDLVESKLDTVATELKDKIKKETEKQKDKLKEELKERLDSTAADILTDTLQVKLEQKAEEILGGQAKEGIDSLKSKIKDWNPFKKKKN